MSQSPQESPQPDLKIVYNVLFDKDSDDFEIFVMDLDGQNPKNLSNSKGVDWVDHPREDRIYFPKKSS